MIPGSDTDPLSTLRPYQLPEPLPWWPPAPGWWLLAGLAALAFALWRWRRRHRSPARRATRAALRELAALRADWHRSGDSAALMRGLSALLRRFVLAQFPRSDAAGLHGEAWLAFLARKAGDVRFQQGPGRLLLTAPYRPGPCDEAALVADLVEDLLRRSGSRSEAAVR